MGSEAGGVGSVKEDFRTAVVTTGPASDIFRGIKEGLLRRFVVYMLGVEILQ